MSDARPIDQSLSAVVATTNRTGWCTLVPSRLNRAFIDYAAASSEKVLEIGGGTGVVALAALRKTARLVFNDMAAKHIDAFTHQAAAEGLAPLGIALGRFPNELEFPDASFAAIHLSNIVHFLSPGELTQALEKVARWLRPNGRVFIQTSNVYVGNYYRCIPLFEERRSAGLKHPGFIEDVKAYVTGHDPAQVPASMHLMTKVELSDAVEDAGLEIIEAYEYRREALPEIFHYDGRENVAVIAAKASV
jgi:SAM-dependent methyltransferase